jgi:hypothetical protein
MMGRRYIFGFATAAVLALVCASDVVASSRKAQKIVKKYIKATGGRKLSAFDGIKIVGRVEFLGREAPFTLWIKRPGRSRLEMNVGGLEVIQAYNGAMAWWINPFMGASAAKEMPADFAALLIRWSSIESPLIDYERKRHRVLYREEQSLQGGNAHRLQVLLADGDRWDVYIDSGSYLEVRRSYQQTFRGRTMQADTYFSDYRQVEGIMVPQTVRGVGPGGDAYHMSLDRWLFGVEIDTEIFEMPDVKPAQSKAPGLPALRDVGQLVEEFNIDSGRVRLFVILSPN